VLWTFFGKNLPVGHWGMLPFLWAAILFLYRLGKKLGGAEWAWWLLPLALLDPVFIGQSALVSPDLMLAAFFLCSLDGILGRNNWLLALGIAGLCAVSMRGMMCSAALFAGMFWIDRKTLLQHSWTAFLPGFLLASSFLLWHRLMSGWIGYHAGSPWAPAFRPAGAMEIVRNGAILAWRWLDFGRAAEWICVGILFWRSKKKMPLAGAMPIDRRLQTLFLSLFVLLSFSALRYHNLSAHRYFLPLFLMFHLIVFQWIVRVEVLRPITKKWIFSALAAVLALGNFQVYPHGISMDWDCTLAHLPYHRMRQDGIGYLKRQDIPLREVGSAFPNINTFEHISLDMDTSSFVPIDTLQNRYLFISNVFNDVSKENRADWQQHWELIWQQKNGPVWGEIYRKKAF
jgi:hypothetical protein